VPKKLKVDKSFVPCEVNDGDEIFRNGIFHFNISKMISQLNSKSLNVVLCEMDASEFYSAFSKINEDHIDSVNVNKPVILAEIAPSRYNLIDGNHRVEKARRAGIKLLSCYKITVDQHLSFLTDKGAYESYIEYWNSKL
jgi:hypothetical protein